MEQLPKDRDIVAILPAYGEMGDHTLLYLRSGTCRVLAVKIKTIIRHLAQRQCKDVSLMRAWASRYTRQKIGVPLPVSWELVLVPFKARQPKVAGDETMGCINFAHLREIKQVKGKTILRLTNGQEIPVLWNTITMQHHIRDARLIQMMILHRVDEALLHRIRVFV